MEASTVLSKVIISNRKTMTDAIRVDLLLHRFFFTAKPNGNALIQIRGEVGPDGPGDTTKGDDSSYQIDNIELVDCQVTISNANLPRPTFGTSYQYQIPSTNAKTFVLTGPDPLP